MANMKTKTTDPIDSRLRSLGLPDYGSLLGLLLADRKTARKLAGLLDAAQARRTLEAHDCRTWIANGGALRLATPSGHEAKLSVYCTSTTTRRLTIEASEQRVLLEVAPGELLPILRWVPALVDALASGAPAPAVPLAMAPSDGRGRPLSAAAAALLAK